MSQPFSSGKHAIGFCDMCGFQFKLHDLRKEIYDQIWTGNLVCEECLDVDQPQLQLGKVPMDDPQALKNARPDQSLIESRDIQWGWNPVGGGGCCRNSDGINMNYSQLSTQIQEYVQSTETSFVANIPNFVQLAEERIYNTVQIPALRQNSTATASIGNQYMSLPSDWLSTFSLAAIHPSTGVYTYLLNKDVNFIRECYTTAGTQGLPQYYAIWDDNTMILGPTPNLAYTLELHYYYYPPSIVNVGTSWLGTNFETVLLYGSLREAYTYLKGEQDMMNYYEQKYQEALGQLKRLGDGLDRQDAYRSGQARIPVTS